MCDCEWVCAYVCVGYSCVLMCVWVGVSEGTNVVLTRYKFVGVS